MIRRQESSTANIGETAAQGEAVPVDKAAGQQTIQERAETTQVSQVLLMTTTQDIMLHDDAPLENIKSSPGRPTAVQFEGGSAESNQQADPQKQPNKLLVSNGALQRFTE